MTPRRIVVTVPWATRAGGAENILWSFLQHVDRSRIEPVVVFFEDGPWEREVADLGLRTAVVPSGRLRQPHNIARAIWKLAGILRHERPDLVLNWSPKTQLYGATAAALAGMPRRTVWWQQGIPTLHWLDQVATLLPARAVGTYSEAAAAAQRRIRPRRRVVVAPPGIEPPVPASTSELDELRRSLGLPDRRTVIGVVGRMEPGKRQDVVIRAVGELVEGGHDVHCLVVGGTAFGLSSEYEPSLRALAADSDLTDRVTFTGQVPNATRYLQLMDVLASASVSESFGIALVEAMAFGVPVVAYDAGGPAEIIEDGVSGLLVREPTPSAMADGIAQVATRDELRLAMSRAGVDRFEAEFTAVRWAQRLTEFLESHAG